MDNINWEFLVQVGILISLVFLIFQVKEVVATLNIHFEQVHDKQDDMMKELGHIESNQKLS